VLHHLHHLCRRPGPRGSPHGLALGDALRALHRRNIPRKKPFPAILGPAADNTHGQETPLYRIRWLINPASVFMHAVPNDRVDLPLRLQSFSGMCHTRTCQE
jgi:hypothetical protein